MKIPLSWLREYVDLTIPLPDLIDRLTVAGLEVLSVKLIGVPVPEGLHCKIEDPGPVWSKDKIVTAKVLEVTRVPGTDKLKFVKLDLGHGREPKTVITGAGNLHPGDSGQVVVLAYAGAVLFDGYSDKQELKELKPKPIRGFPSDSMVCSVRELGIADEHEGILLLPKETPVGMPLVDILGDVVLDLDVLPNMARCLSIVGVAREVAALTGQRLRPPSRAVSEQAEPIHGQVDIEIADPSLCRRYTAALIKGIALQPSPFWMQRRLTLSGMRPISNVVDVANYMMLKLGQPLHAFDYDKLKARSAGRPPLLAIRPARPGETLITLDGIERKLPPSVLIIADQAGPIALAGVMGGLETEVSAQTRNILLESAHFDPGSIRRTARRLDLHSEASMRFSRGIHPELALSAADRAAELLRQLTGGKVCQGRIDSYPAPWPDSPIRLELAYVERLLGIAIEPEEIARILRSLEYRVDGLPGDSAFTVLPPPHRVDIQHGPADLVEDIIRIHGYKRLPATPLADELPEQDEDKSLLIEEHARDLLAACGLQEVITPCLTSADQESPLGVQGPYVTLANPIHSERGVMRKSLAASVLQVAASNLRTHPGVRLFEIGKVFLPSAPSSPALPSPPPPLAPPLVKGGKGGSEQGVVAAGPLPREPKRLVIVMAGPRFAEHWDSAGKVPSPLDFFDLKGLVETVLSRLHLPEVAFEKSAAQFLHPGQAAALSVSQPPLPPLPPLAPPLVKGGEGGSEGGWGQDNVSADGLPLGVLGRLHPALAQRYGLGKQHLFIADLDWDLILTLVPERHAFQPISPFPPILQDIALVVEEDIPAARVAGEIWAGGAELLKGVRLFDVYRGPNLPAGKKSLAYALTYQAADRSLTDKEVAKAHAKIVGRLEKQLGAALRA